MSKPYFCAVIGKNFGDEGKGMAVDFLSSRHDKVLVIRHNGGAQSGHTVELPDKRFVFHELSSGSFRHADTLWVDTYFPDLYKLGEEASAFCHEAGFIPKIYAQTDTTVTIIDDVLLNMAAEVVRGAKRHGSCGMGIYEAQCRVMAGYGITLGELSTWSVRELVERLQEIRNSYLPLRMRELGLTEEELGEYDELLKSRAVLENAAEEMLGNLKYVELVHVDWEFLNQYNCVIFENGQGLLLDSENVSYSPHVTASRTGLNNPCDFLQKLNWNLDEVLYVTRSYVTRHGAGPLPNECGMSELGIEQEDRTNQENPWQGRLRYARHEDVKEFARDIMEDLQNVSRCNLPMPKRSLLITHLNETGNCIMSREGNCLVEEFCKMRPITDFFECIYVSGTYFSQDIYSYSASSDESMELPCQNKMIQKL